MKKTTERIMPKGKYYIGDLCYVMHDEWDEVHKLLFPEPIDSSTWTDGVFTLKDGRKFAIYSTAYGDGCYLDQDGKEYGVDAGSIGCIKVSDIDQNNKENDIKLGHVHEFKSDFITDSDEDGNITFGDIVIKTGDDEDDFEEDECYDDDEDECYVDDDDEE
jgi:hypothetical protein